MRALACWKGNVQIRQHAAAGHQVDHLVDMRIGIHVVHAYPHTEFTQGRREIIEMSAALDARATAAPRT